MRRAVIAALALAVSTAPPEAKPRRHSLIQAASGRPFSLDGLMSTLNRKAFFDAARKDPCGGRLSGEQVDGMSAILSEWERRLPTGDLRWLAYMLATGFHETACAMQPVHEHGGEDYLRRMYDPKGDRPKVAARLGNTRPGDGALYAGRGYVQLTGRRNYEEMGRLLSVDLVGNPDLAMQPAIAAAIMFEGMLRAESSVGDFTGRCLEQYFNATTDDPVNARRIINGLDRAEVIARYHRAFLKALRAADAGSAA
jgi:putative chitinase